MYIEIVDIKIRYDERYCYYTMTDGSEHSYKMNLWDRLTNRMTANSWIPIIFGGMMTIVGTYHADDSWLTCLYIGLPLLTYGLLNRAKERSNG